MVRGYPGSWKNTMCTMNGNFLKTLTRRRGQYTGRAIVYDIDQSPGNSGGPVFAVDPSAVRALKESTFTQEEDNDDTKCLIGIVTGITIMRRGR
jgi:V8-like Glu-specific endopeptidase